MNLVLIGLPGSGKTTVGRILARRLFMPFTDCDEAIAATAGMSIPQIFAVEGERGFRTRESTCLTELLAKDGQVIATGGGAVLAAENRQRLAGVPTVYLNRSIKAITRDFRAEGRPLMAHHSLAQLAAERAVLYQACAVLTTGDGTPEETAEIILRWWRKLSCDF